MTTAQALSKTPIVLGLVSISAATSSVTRFSSAATSTMPSEFDLMFCTW